MLHAEIVTHFMRYNEPTCQTNVFINVTTALHITHTLDTSQPKCATGSIVTRTEVMTKIEVLNFEKKQKYGKITSKGSGRSRELISEFNKKLTQLTRPHYRDAQRQADYHQCC